MINIPAIADTSCNINRAGRIRVECQNLPFTSTYCLFTTAHEPNLLHDAAKPIHSPGRQTQNYSRSFFGIYGTHSIRI